LFDLESLALALERNEQGLGIQVTLVKNVQEAEEVLGVFISQMFVSVKCAREEL